MTRYCRDPNPTTGSNDPVWVVCKRQWTRWMEAEAEQGRAKTAAAAAARAQRREERDLRAQTRRAVAAARRADQARRRLERERAATEAAEAKRVAREERRARELERQRMAELQREAKRVARTPAADGGYPPAERPERNLRKVRRGTGGRQKLPVLPESRLDHHWHHDTEARLYRTTAWWGRGFEWLQPFTRVVRVGALREHGVRRAAVQKAIDSARLSWEAPQAASRQGERGSSPGVEGARTHKGSGQGTDGEWLDRRVWLGSTDSPGGRGVIPVAPAEGSAGGRRQVATGDGARSTERGRRGGGPVVPGEQRHLRRRPG